MTTIQSCKQIRLITVPGSLLYKPVFYRLSPTSGRRRIRDLATPTMPTFNSQNIQPATLGHRLLPDFVGIVQDSRDETTFLRKALQQIADESSAIRSSSVVQGVKGQWRTVASAGTEATLPGGHVVLG